MTHAKQEELFAQVHALGMHAGDVEMRLTRDCAKQRIIVSSEGRSVGLAKFFSDRSSSARIPIDPSSGLPLRYRSVLTKGDEVVRYRLRFAPGEYRWTREQEGKTKRGGKRRLPGKSNAHSFESALLALRHWRPQTVSSASLLVVLGRRLYELEAKFAGRESIEHGGKLQSAIRIEGTLYKIDLKPDESQQARSFRVWFGDDERRVPLRAVASTGLGDVRVELQSHRAEPGAPCEVARMGR